MKYQGLTLEERERVRELADEVATVSNLPVMEERRQLWKSHNSLRPTRPLVLVYPEGSWAELIPPTQLVCLTPIARAVEWQLLARLYRYRHLHDDMPIEPTWVVPRRITTTGWGMEPDRKGTASEFLSTWTVATNIGALPRIWETNVHVCHQAKGFRPLLQTAADLCKITFPDVTYDEHQTREDSELFRDLVGDILDVQVRGITHTTYHLMQQYTELRGLEQMMVDLYDNPGMVHDTLTILEAGHRRLLKQYEQLDLLSANNNETYHGTGGVGYIDTVSAERVNGRQGRAAHQKSQSAVKTDLDPSRTACLPRDMWAAAEAQETAQVSPDQWAEFVLPHEMRLLERFGLTGYGCCEDLSRKIKHLRDIPNLRRVSVSPFADVKACAEQLQGNYIYSWKPNPATISFAYDEDAIRKQIQHTLDVTARNGCRLEVILKDLHTVANEPERLTRWTDLVQELISQSEG